MRSFFHCTSHDLILSKVSGLENDLRSVDNGNKISTKAELYLIKFMLLNITKVLEMRKTELAGFSSFRATQVLVSHAKTFHLLLEERKKERKGQTSEKLCVIETYPNSRRKKFHCESM